MTEASVALSAIAVLATIAGVLGWVIKYILRDFNSTQRELSKNIAKQSEIGDKQLQLVEKQLETTIERDRRDMEFHKQVIKNFEELNKKADKSYQAILRNHEALSTVANQSVKEQTVEHQTIKEG